MNIKKQKLSVIILAAGMGTRMKSKLSKLLHKIAGREMVSHVANTAKNLNASEINVVASENNCPLIKKALGSIKTNCSIQKERNGTAGAVKVALKKLNPTDNVLVMYGDVTLVRTETYQKMVDMISDKKNKVEIIVLGFHTGDTKNKYGRLIYGKNNSLKRIVEYKDATEAERNITLCNSGIIAVKYKVLKDLIKKVKNNNASKEYYLTDIIGLAAEAGMTCKYIEADESEVMGVNTRKALAEAERLMQNRFRDKFMSEGVTLIDPSTVYFSCDTEIGKDVVIYPNVFIGEGVKIADNVTIKSFNFLENCTIKENISVGHFH